MRRALSDVCPRCLIAFPHHIVVHARCTKRWRGHNFDAAAAEGAVGAAVADVLGMRVKTTSELEAFMRRALVRTYGQALDPNPALEFDPAVGEAYEFHVGIREALDDSTYARVAQAVREAVGKSRNFSLV